MGCTYFRLFEKSRIILGCAAAFFSFGFFAASGASLSLGWSPSPSSEVAGYIVYYGTHYGWYPYSVNAGANTNVTVSGLTPGKPYYFVAVAYNADDVVSAFSNAVTNNAPSGGALPQIQVQPMSQTVADGTFIILSVGASSATPIAYQWYENGNAIQGATNSVLIMPQISTTNAGGYKVLVSNSAGTSSSHVATITVLNLITTPPNPSQAVQPGTYNGIFCQTGTSGGPAISEGTTGFLSNLTVVTNGGYSFRLILQGIPFSCSGKVNSDGEIAAVALSSQSAVSNLSVVLFDDSVAGAGRLTGVVSNMNPANPWVASVAADLATNSFAQPAVLEYYSPTPLGQISLSRTCTLTVTSSGSVKLLGLLGDGAMIQQSGYVGGDGYFPVYQTLYNSTGLLAGWLTFTEGVPVGNLTWIRPANSGAYPNGFTNVISFGSGLGLSTNCFQLIP